MSEIVRAQPNPNQGFNPDRRNIPEYARNSNPIILFLSSIVHTLKYIWQSTVNGFKSGFKKGWRDGRGR